MTEKINKKLQRLGTVYMEKRCPKYKSHLPTRLASYPAWRMSQLTFHTSHYKTWRTRLEERPTKPSQLCWYGSRVTLLAGRNVSPYKNFGPPSRGQLGLSETIRARGSVVSLEKRINFLFSSHIKARWSWLSWESDPRLPGKWGSLDINLTAFSEH